MKIILRTENGWSAPVELNERNARFVEGKAIFACTRCGDPLYMAPSGQAYCDSVHKRIPTAQEYKLGLYTSTQQP